MAGFRLLTWLTWAQAQLRDATPDNKRETLYAVIGTASFAVLKPDESISESSILGKLRTQYHPFRPQINFRHEAVDELIAFAIGRLHELDPNTTNTLCDELLAAPISPGLTARLRILQAGFGTLDQRMNSSQRAVTLETASAIIRRQQSTPVRGAGRRVLNKVYSAELAFAA